MAYASGSSSAGLGIFDNYHWPAAEPAHPVLDEPVVSRHLPVRSLAHTPSRGARGSRWSLDTEDRSAGTSMTSRTSSSTRPTSSPPTPRHVHRDDSAEHKRQEASRRRSVTRAQAQADLPYWPPTEPLRVGAKRSFDTRPALVSTPVLTPAMPSAATPVITTRPRTRSFGAAMMRTLTGRKASDAATPPPVPSPIPAPFREPTPSSPSAKSSPRSTWTLSSLRPSSRKGSLRPISRPSSSRGIGGEIGSPAPSFADLNSRLARVGSSPSLSTQARMAPPRPYRTSPSGGAAEWEVEASVRRPSPDGRIQRKLPPRLSIPPPGPIASTSSARPHRRSEARVLDVPAIVVPRTPHSAPLPVRRPSPAYIDPQRPWDTFRDPWQAQPVEPPPSSYRPASPVPSFGSDSRSTESDADDSPRSLEHNGGERSSRRNRLLESTNSRLSTITSNGRPESDASLGSPAFVQVETFEPARGRLSNPWGDSRAGSVSVLSGVLNDMAISPLSESAPFPAPVPASATERAERKARPGGVIDGVMLRDVPRKLIDSPGRSLRRPSLAGRKISLAGEVVWYAGAEMAGETPPLPTADGQIIELRNPWGEQSASALSQRRGTAVSIPHSVSSMSSFSYLGLPAEQIPAMSGGRRKSASSPAASRRPSMKHAHAKESMAIPPPSPFSTTMMDQRGVRVSIDLSYTPSSITGGPDFSTYSW